MIFMHGGSGIKVDTSGDINSDLMQKLTMLEERSKSIFKDKEEKKWNLRIMKNFTDSLAVIGDCGILEKNIFALPRALTGIIGGKVVFKYCAW